MTTVAAFKPDQHILAGMGLPRRARQIGAALEQGRRNCQFRFTKRLF